MEGFQLIDDIENFYEDIDEEIFENIKYDLCPECGVKMNDTGNNTYTCPECNIVNQNVEVSDMSTMTSDMSYNTNYRNGSMLRCSGSNGYKYQSLLRNNSDYSIIQEENIKNILFTYNYNSSKTMNIPKDILLTVSDYYKEIRETGCIYRGTILRGILAAITYYLCIKRKLCYKPVEIFEWFNITNCNYSKGDKIVRDLIEKKKLSLDISDIKIEENFIYSYATRLDFPEDVINFLEELMTEVTKKRLINPNAKSSTRALSVIYLYILAARLDITQEILKEKFNASYGTIRSITSNLIKSIPEIEHIFQKYNISSKIIRKRKSNKNKKNENNELTE